MPAEPVPPVAATPGWSRQRIDIQGMRAVAVASVVIAHAGASWLPGGFVGVDLFFVLSGFLITELLVREWTRAGRISLAAFWARRARRLLPAATVVLVVTAVATAVWMPPNQVSPIERDVWWAALFSANWRFAQQGTDYFAQDRATSPVEHYWSLGVEEQFYLVWPLVVVGLGLVVALVARQRLRRRASTEQMLRRDVAAVAAVIVVLSFLYEWRLTYHDQPYAYFGTPARAWQLGVGALVAAGIPWWRRLPRGARQLLALTGAVGLGWSFVQLHETGGGTPYPGVIALMPTLATAALVMAGTGWDGMVPTVVGRLLSPPPLVWLGDISYSLYLWHFPILVIGTTRLPHSGWQVPVGLVAASVVVAWASYRFVERPVRHLRPLVARPALSVAVGAVLVLGSTGATAFAPALTPTTEMVSDDGHHIDLADQLDDPSDGTVSVPGCTAIEPDSSDFGACDTFGAPGASKRVIVIGDSHAASLAPGISAAAKQQGWAMTLWSKPSCNIAAVEQYDPTRNAPKSACVDFQAKAVARAIAQHPALVVLTSNEMARVYVAGRPLATAAASRPYLLAGWRTTVTELTAAGLRVVIVPDWPHATTDPATCLLQHGDVNACLIPRPTGTSLERAAVAGLAGVKVVDIASSWCSATTCRPVKGGVLVYRDRNHLTAPFAQTLAPVFVRQLLTP